MLRPPDIDGLYADLWRTTVEPCLVCRGAGTVSKESDDPLFPTSSPCDCKREVMLRCALRSANVPREFWEVESLEFEWNKPARAVVEKYLEDLAGARREGRGFLMIGANGVGKTACACVVLCRAARAGYSIAYLTAHGLVTSVIPATRDPELNAWRRQLLEADFLVLDEMGKEHRAAGSEFAVSELDSLLRWRRGELRPTILCTNLEAREFASPELYGESLWSILRDRLETLKFRDGDYRAELKKRRKGGA